MAYGIELCPLSKKWRASVTTPSTNASFVPN